MDIFTTNIYGSRFAAEDLPSTEIPETEMPKEVAYIRIKDHLALGRHPALNLSTFVTTYMEEEAEKLVVQSFSKNFIDRECYPKSSDIQDRCVSMIARLFHAPISEGSTGVSTVGVSEAVMLSLLALKLRWKDKRRKQCKWSDKPNVIMSSASSMHWAMATQALEVEQKWNYCVGDEFTADPEEIVAMADENTIGICCTLGTSFTGEYENVKRVNELLEEKGSDVPIHVDADSGGFVAPFIVPDLVWDFRLSNVVSINVSGHKYGLTYPSINWLIWRGPEYFPDTIVAGNNRSNSVGADQADSSPHFSAGASQVIGQYYQLIRLGKSGYRAIMSNLTHTADYLSDCLEAEGFLIASKKAGEGLPLVAFRLGPGLKKRLRKYDEVDLARQLGTRGWIVLAYTMPPHLQETKILKVVIRQDFTRSRCDSLLDDIMACLEVLENLNKNKLGHGFRYTPVFPQRYTWTMVNDNGTQVIKEK